MAEPGFWLSGGKIQSTPILAPPLHGGSGCGAVEVGWRGLVAAETWSRGGLAVWSGEEEPRRTKVKQRYIYIYRERERS